ncbi:MAG: GtrA family protein [Eubacteriales bacterium]|nr:GtrA family protein [Eubacteriales bacterium]
MKKLIGRLYANDKVRYVFFGGCTTLVNMICFYLLRSWGVRLNLANLISILTAIIFAYVVNSRFVFEDKCQGLWEHGKTFLRFFAARMATMAVELGGVWLLVEWLRLPDMLGKFITQFVVMVLNYLFSRFLVFTSRGG